MINENNEEVFLLTRDYFKGRMIDIVFKDLLTDFQDRYPEYKNADSIEPAPPSRNDDFHEGYYL